MKVALVALLFAASALAQSPSAVAQLACGPDNFRFNVKLDKSTHAPAQSEPGKATVYFIHEADSPTTFGYPTTMIGMDGAWVGANKSSYFLDRKSVV